jgi:hypothetical protein
MGHINSARRKQPCIFENGLLLTASGSGTATVNFGLSSGQLYRMHLHDVSGVASPADFFINNDEVTVDKVEDNLNSISTYTDGSSNVNEYCVYILFIAHLDATTGLFLLKPSAGYNTESEAYTDPDQTANFSIPSTYVGASIYVARVVARRTASATTIFEINTDIRGLLPSSVAGGGLSGVPDHGGDHIGADPIPWTDSTFSVGKAADATAREAFDLTNISTATTRYLKPPDRDVDLGKIAYDETALAAEETVIVAADEVGFKDTSTSLWKRISWTNVLASIKTYTDTLYVLLAGKSGGQTLSGGTDSGDDLTLQSTSNATKGKIFLGANSVYDEANNRLGINTTTPSYGVDAQFSDLNIGGEPASAAPDVAVNTTTGNLNGAYRYRITCVTNKGETEYGVYSGEVSPINEQVDLTNIPTGSSEVVARKIYRTLSGGGFPWVKMYLVDTINDNITTIYTDNIADGALGASAPATNTTGAALYQNGEKILENNSVLFSFGINNMPNATATNTAIGNGAGLSITSAYNNTLLGQSAGRGLTTGIRNTAIGDAALYSSFPSSGTAKDNFAGGYRALYDADTASYSVVIGGYAGSNLLTGNDNLLLGYKAGFTGISDLSGSVVLGASANVQASGDTNEIVIGASVTGNGSNTTTIGGSSNTHNYFNGEIFVKAETSDSSAHVVKVDDSADANLLSIRNDGLITTQDGATLNTGTTTGLQIATATSQKLGFFGSAPITQPTEITDELTTITHTAPGTPDYAVQDLTNTGGYGFVTQDEGNTVLSVIANLQARVNELETTLANLGLLADAD